MHSALATSRPRDDGYLLDVSGAAVLKSSKHQQAAQALVAFLVSSGGQHVLAHSDSWEYPSAPAWPTRTLPPLSRPAAQGTSTWPRSATASRRSRCCSRRDCSDAPQRAPWPEPPGRRRRRGLRLRRVLAVLPGQRRGRARAAAAARCSWSCRPATPAGREVHSVLFRPLSAELLRNTVELAVLVTAATAVIGTAAAWCVERTALPLRRMWARAGGAARSPMPDFVVGYAWHSLSPGVHRLRARGRGHDPRPLPAGLPAGGGGAAPHRPGPGGDAPRRSGWAGGRRSAGWCSRRSARRCCGGSLVVDAGAAGRVRRVRDPRLPDLHHRDLHRAAGRPVRPPPALALLLVALGIVVLLGEAAGPAAAGSAGAARRPRARRRRRRLGRGCCPILAALAALVGLAARRAGRHARLLARALATRPRCPRAPPCSRRPLATARYAAAAAALATAAAVPVALLAAQRRGALAARRSSAARLLDPVGTGRGRSR